MSATPALVRLDAINPSALHARLVLAAGLALLAASSGGLVRSLGAPGDLLFCTMLALGALAGGVVADGSGRRRPVLAATVASLFGYGAIATDAPLFLAVTAALGALIVSGTAWVAETSPLRFRLLFTGALALFVVGGQFVPFYGAGVAAFAAIWLWRRLPESPRWLHARGRAVEADAAVRRVERAGGAPAITLTRVAPVPPQPGGFSDLLKPTMAVGALLSMGLGLTAIQQPALAVALSTLIVAVATEGISAPSRGLAGGLIVTANAAGIALAAQLAR